MLFLYFDRCEAPSLR